MTKQSARSVVIAALVVVAILATGFFAGTDLPDPRAMAARGS